MGQKAALLTVFAETGECPQRESKAYKKGEAVVQWISRSLVDPGDAAGMMVTCLLLSSLWALASGNLPLSLPFLVTVMVQKASGDKGSICSSICCQCVWKLQANVWLYLQFLHHKPVTHRTKTRFQLLT